MKGNKDFEGEFDRLYKLVKGNCGFSFARFSDGERVVLRNKKLVIAENYFIQEDLFGNVKRGTPGGKSYLPEERKEFIPEKHSFFHDKLIEAYKFRKTNYFKGICGDNELTDASAGADTVSTWRWMVDLHGGEDDSLTYANVFLNRNYPLFVEKMIPEFMNHDVILIANKNSTTDLLPFKVKKFFPIGENCMINDYGLIEKIKDYIREENISNHLFLFSAATLSNYLCYELYKEFDNNKYMDIGSTLGPLLGLEGWKNSRSYLLSYWYNVPSPYIHQADTWGKI